MVEEKKEITEEKKIIVEKSPDEMEGYITVNVKEGEEEPTIEEAYQAIKEAGITYGIKDEEINKIFEKKAYNMKILIAAGTPVVDGKDAEIKYHFDTTGTLQPKITENGRVDFKETSLIQNVKPGEILAEIIPPVEGKEGMTITGKKLIPKQGKDCQLPKGKNTEPSPDNPNILVASIGGNVSLKGRNIVEVNPVFTIKGDIDFSTGNVKYVGFLHIKGDVKSGFSVFAEEDIMIDGVVEDATVESMKNVTIKTGFIGRGEGKIIAGGNVVLKYAENQTIIAKGDVIAAESLRHCNIESEGKVIVRGQKGIIVGGRVVAVNGVEAKTLGNYQNTKTSIEVGLTDKMQKELQKYQEDIKTNNENIEKVNKAINILQRIKTLKKGLPEEKLQLLGKLQSILVSLKKQKNELTQIKEKIDQEITKHTDAFIKVQGTVYPGVRINILNRKKLINEPLTGVTFRFFEDEITTINSNEGSQ